MSEFVKEMRYYVIKVSDAVTFSDAAKEGLNTALYAAQIVRKLRGASALECVVVESDWPEYEVVWDMIQARVEGRPNRIAALEAQVAEHEGEIDRRKKAWDDNWILQMNHAAKYLDQIGELSARVTLLQTVAVRAQMYIHSDADADVDVFEVIEALDAAGYPAPEPQP